MYLVGNEGFSWLDMVPRRADINHLEDDYRYRFGVWGEVVNVVSQRETYRLDRHQYSTRKLKVVGIYSNQVVIWRKRMAVSAVTEEKLIRWEGNDMDSSSRRMLDNP